VQRTGVWVMFVFLPWPDTDILPGSTPEPGLRLNFGDLVVLLTICLAAGR
jgi:hypothetical protein